MATHLGNRPLRNLTPLVAVGGTVQDFNFHGVLHRAHVFTGSDSFNVVSIRDYVGSTAGAVAFSPAIRYLIVGGGGGGGARLSRSGGGAGAGGVLAGNMILGVGSYPAVVGNGGAGEISDLDAPNVAAQNGESSSIFSLTAQGGGRGRGILAAGNGGCGGGGADRAATGVPSLGGDGIQGQGSDGGDAFDTRSGAGGGGFSMRGQDSVSSGAGVGGDGYFDPELLIPLGLGIDGWIAGGGAGGPGRGGPSRPGGLGGGGTGISVNELFLTGEDTGFGGEPNTGSGGGGTGERWNNNDIRRCVGGPGGSGLIVVYYPIRRAA